MFWNSVNWFLILLLNASVFATIYEMKDNILELTSENFNMATKEHHFLCVCFYSKNSRASKEFEGKFKNLRDVMKKKGAKIEFAKLDIGKHGAIEKQFFIFEIPMVKFFKMGRHYDFRGQKEVKHLKAWLELAINIPVVISTHKEFEDIKNRGTVIIGCFPGKSPVDGYNTFYNVSAQFVSAKHIPLPRFAVITKASVSRDVGLLKGSVTIFKHFEATDKSVYSGSISDAKAMLKFCEEEAQPTVFPYGHDEFTMKMSSTSVKYNHILFMSSKDSKFNQIFSSFKAAAKEFRTDIDNIDVLFIHADSSKEHLERVVSYYHVDVNRDIPCNRMTKLDKYHSKFIPLKQDFTREGFIDFTRRVMGGEIARSIRSQILPGDWDKYPVKILVGTNYEDIAYAKGKIVFIMFYVPNHKESEDMLAVIDEVGLHYKLNSSVTIGVMNVKDNDGETDVHFGYPSFKLYTKENKVLKFKGKKAAAAIQAFIDSNGTTHLGAVLGNPEETDSHIDVAEYLDAKPEEDDNFDYESEEQRQKEWTAEELQMIENAVKVTEGEKPDEHDKYKVFSTQGDGHSSSTDDVITHHEHMDPKEHARVGDDSHEEYVHDHKDHPQQDDNSHQEYVHDHDDHHYDL